MASTSKKYLSLEEAAAMLSLPKDDLMRKREQGEIRGFADRGNWKFRVEDVQELARTLQTDSSPEVALLPEDSGPLAGARRGDSSRDVGEQPTIIRKKSEIQKTSDSDVRLVSDDAGLSFSDSDVRLLAPGASGESDSDSDVKLVGAATDSDISLAPIEGKDSDSDVKLVAESQPDQKGSDSDVQLVGAADEDSSDSDVALVGSDSAIALDVPLDDSEHASVLSDDMGLAIDAGSSIGLAAESGISLEAGESGISLEADEEEGITLGGTESGISLEGAADSGISLEDSDEYGGTVPMLAAGGDDTEFQIPSLSEDDSAFDLQAAGGSDDTGMLELEDSGELDDAAFDLDEGDAGEEELEVAPDVLGEDDELDELDVFEPEEGIFEEGGTSREFAAPLAGPAMAVEAEWGAGVVSGLALSSVVMVVACIVAFDLVRSMWQWGETTPLSSFLLETLGGK